MAQRKINSSQIDVGSGPQQLIINSDIGSTVQAFNVNLNSISLLGTAANKILYTDGIGSWNESNITTAGRAIINLNGGLVFNSKSAAIAYIDANGIDNGRAYFITSGDGGDFIGVIGGSGYANDSAASCGTIFIPTGGDGSSALKRRLSGYIHTDAFGITFDGVTDDRAAWIEILAAASANNVKIKSKAGTSLIKGSISPSQYCTVEGVSLEDTIIKFQNNGIASLIGIVCASDMHFKDLTIQADVNGFSWCATHGFSAASVSNVTFERVKFKGTTTKTGHWAGWVSGGDATKVRYLNCEYDTLTFGIAKDNADTSNQSDFYWHNPKATNCTDVININSPLGSWTKVGIFGGTMENISQFPIAFAGNGCYDSVINGTAFYNTQYEAVHYEALTHNHVCTNITTRLTNQTSGVVGSSGAMNGAIQVITSSYNIKIVNNTFTLTTNTTGSPNGVVAHGGGGASVSNIDVHGNTFYCKSGCIAVYSNATGISSGPTYVKGIDISGNTFENQSGSKSSKLLDLPYNIISGGGNVFVNPGVVMNVDNNSFGGLRNSTFIGDLSTLDFLTGNGAAGTSVIFNGFTLREDFTVDATPTWQNVVPVGTLFDGLVSMRYIGNGTAEAFTKTVKLRYDGTTLTIADEQAQNSGAVGALPGAPHWQVSGGYLQSKAYRATPQNGQVLFTFDGPWYP